jgi:Zn-dependent peptidase ImmA (M78 family)/transcriptional regulator with XRE-family HTH domain
MSKFDKGGTLIPPKLIPERIKEARESVGYGLEDFADHLGVTRQAVAQYENGQIKPAPEIVSKIIASTGQPISFFTHDRRRGSETFGTPFWRALKRTRLNDRNRITRRLEWATDLVQYLENWIELPSVDLPDFDFNPDTENEEEIELAAEKLRDHWDLGTGPITDLPKIMESHGFILIRDYVNCEDMDAVSRWQVGKPYVLYSANVESAPRTYYNLSHELAHMCLHATVQVNQENLARIEKQANRFAGAFLLPRSSFSNEVLGSSINYFKYLKERWGVSIAAMIYRAKDLEIISKNQHQYLMRQMNAQKIRIREPLDDLFTPPEPSVLRDAFYMLIEHKVQTKREIQNNINLNMNDVEKLIGVETGYLDNKVIDFSLKFKNDI